MRYWSVYSLVLILLLMVLCNGNLKDHYKIDVYAYSKADAQRFKSFRLNEFYSLLLSLYETCDKISKQLYEILSKLLELYDQTEAVPNKIKRIYDYINGDLAREYKNSISKEKQMIQLVKDIVTRTCYNELHDWAEFEKEKCINAIKQDDDYNIVKSNYEYYATEVNRMLGEFLVKKVHKFKEDLKIRKEDVVIGVGEFNEKVYATLEEYVRELLLMKRLSYSTKDMIKFSEDFLKDASSTLSVDIANWTKKLRHGMSEIPAYLRQLNDLQNGCEEIKHDLNECLETLENEKVIYMMNMVQFFLSAQYFVVKNNSLVEVNCEEHVPIHGAKFNERLTSTERKGGAEIWYFKGKNENDESYERTLRVRMIRNDQVELHETIIYSNSETASLDNTYILKF